MGDWELRGGKWTKRVSLTDPATGKRRQPRITAATKREGRQIEAEMLAAHARGETIDPSKVTVAQYVEQYIERGDVGESTKVRERSTLANFIQSDPLGAMRLQQVKPVHVQGWVDRVSQRLAATTVRTYYAVLRASFSRADALDIVQRTPCRNIKLPKPPPSERAILTVQKARQVVANTSDAKQLAWTLALVMGLRIGEILGLRWSDFDADAGTLRVERTMTRIGTNTWIIGDGAKSATSARTLVLPSVVIAAFKIHRTEQLTRRLAAGEAWSDDDAILDSGLGAHYKSPGTYTVAWTRYRKRHGISDDVTIHGLRHTCASLAIRAGVPITSISRMLGHSNPSITLRVYAHIFAEMEEETASLLDQIYVAA